MKKLNVQSQVMTKRMIVSIALASIMPLSARFQVRSETALQAPRGTEQVHVATDTVPLPHRAHV
jgi:hypothetical protein